MLQVIGSIASIVAFFFGDRVVAKWIGAARTWFRKQADPKLKELAEEQFKQMDAEWENLRQERQSLGPRDENK